MLEALEPRFLMSFSPTGLEQEMLELMNRMRLDPASELGRITDNVATTPAHSADTDINNALTFFNVSGPTLADQWATLTPAPPLAWNEALYNAATAHSQQMIAHDLQEHVLPGELNLGPRIQAAGYTNLQSAGENIFAFGKSPFVAHAAFAIDWGFTPTGIQTPPGHRDNMMSTTFREIGLSVVPEANAATDVGPLVITEDFGNRFSFGNPFLLGAVYRDIDDDGLYDAGEGLGGVNVHIDGAVDFDTTSMTAGGWQIQVPAGNYTVTFSGGPLGSPSPVTGVTVGSANTKVDFRAPRFTDPTLTPASTRVSVVHVQELRDIVNALRTANGLEGFAFTDPVLTPGVSAVRAVHIQQLRQAVNEVFTQAGTPVPTYTDPVIVPGVTTVQAAHIEELRTASRGPLGTPSAVTIEAIVVSSQLGSMGHVEDGVTSTVTDVDDGLPMQSSPTLVASAGASTADRDGGPRSDQPEILVADLDDRLVRVRRLIAESGTPASDIAPIAPDVLGEPASNRRRDILESLRVGI